ncbi:MAG: hypothetical protein RSB41_02225 [Bacilli bacterium]
MKDKRNMFYSNTNEGGFMDPNINSMGTYPNNFAPPSGYMNNQQYSAFGPNVNNPSPMPFNPNNNQLGTSLLPYPNNYNTSEYEERITKLERQIRKLDNRVSALEHIESGMISDGSISVDNNLYMI